MTDSEIELLRREMREGFLLTAKRDGDMSRKADSLFAAATKRLRSGYANCAVYLTTPLSSPRFNP